MDAAKDARHGVGDHLLLFMMYRHGYARVSTDGQSLDAQLDELKAAGCQRVFKEKMSGARSDRRELTKLITKLRNGDTLIVSRLDRPARSSRDLLNILHEIGVKGASFRSLHDPWADTQVHRMDDCF